MKKTRHYTFIDQLCLGLDQAMRAVLGKAHTTNRANPAAGIGEPHLTSDQQRHAAGLMRVNHTGEVCAQALYHAQGLISKRADIKTQMQEAAIEEGDHLAWCQTRLTELGSHTSYLNPFWYVGSFVMGLTAGMIGDRWNLGFLAETENQVVAHLQSHLKLLPAEDQKSQKIVEQMALDEALHRDTARQAGAAELPDVIKKAMTLLSKMMVKTAYKI